MEAMYEFTYVCMQAMCVCVYGYSHISMQALQRQAHMEVAGRVIWPTPVTLRGHKSYLIKKIKLLTNYIKCE